jgi:hypothetical protein
MKPHKFIAAAILSVVLVSCTKSATGQMPTPDMLSDALPTITDMPGEWSETQRQVFNERGPENPSIDPSIWCADAATVTKNLVDLAGDTGADVEMQAVMVGDTPRLMRLQAWANDEVVAYFRDAKEAVRICDGKKLTDTDGSTVEYDVISAHDIGDESISWKQTTVPPASTEGEKMSSISRTTIARFGSIVMILQMGDMATSGTSTLMPEDEWWDIVELAGGKLDDLDEQVHD